MRNEDGKNYVILSALGACSDQKGVNIGIESYMWLKKGKNNQWQSIGTGESVKIEQKEEEVIYGLYVIDADGCYNENGTHIGNGIYVVTQTVYVPIQIPIPQITCNDADGSVQLKDGEEFTFVLTGSAETFGNPNITVTNYDWSLGNANTDTRSIKVTATEKKDSNGNTTHFEYSWYFNGQEIGNGSSLNVTLGVTANGKESDNRASIVLSVASSSDSYVQVSYDPNDKSVLEGVGEEGFVAAGSKLSYKVEFENDPEFATAPAQWVRVFDTLDGTKYDLDSFELQNFCIAGNYF